MRANSIEWIFFEILCLYLLFCASVDCWKFQTPDFDLDRSWAMGVDGQNLCKFKEKDYKRRYYICKQMTKKKIKEGEESKFMFSKESLMKETEMKNKKYECSEKAKTVYFDLQYPDGTQLTALRYLFTCPTKDEEGQRYFFGQGKNENELGVYKIKKLPKSNKRGYCFIGTIKDIDLVYYGRYVRKIWSKIPILNWF